ncbi:PfkB family carbohydrate kinase [uncultured Sphaerochaeta sp.]|uniref:PfkB family carbohydrate kinase n=1 Tax=uncultured Sphaerochaeta sp. TaxID=886478 RepID=UPI002A0A95A0|nr:PfkB family carbohydrate kinase [uncultured Sphaerochaeta sp.]
MLFNSFSLGEVNRCATHFLDASGKGMNTARILSQLGEEAALLTHLGGARKDEMLALCRKDQVQMLYADSKSEIRTCTTLIFDQICTELVEEPQKVAPSTEQEIRKLYTKALKTASAVIICGTRAPGYSENIYSDFTFEAKQQGKFVLLDVKGHDLLSALPFRPDVIKPNLSEFVQTFFDRTIGEQEATEDIKEQVLKKMESLHSLYGCSIVLSRGQQDTWVYDGSLYTCPVEKGHVVNTIGCGDTLSATLTSELVKRHNLQQAIALASHYATKNAENIHPGSII